MDQQWDEALETMAGQNPCLVTRLILLDVDMLLVPISLIALGVAMIGAPPFGKGFGGVSVVLGVVGVVAASTLLVDPLSLIIVVGFFTLILFHLVLGWKVYSLSRVAGDFKKL